MNEVSLWFIIQRGVLLGRTHSLKLRMSDYLGIDVLGDWFLSGDFSSGSVGYPTSATCVELLSSVIQPTEKKLSPTIRMSSRETKICLGIIHATFLYAISLNPRMVPSCASTKTPPPMEYESGASLCLTSKTHARCWALSCSWNTRSPSLFHSLGSGVIPRSVK